MNPTLNWIPKCLSVSLQVFHLLSFSLPHNQLIEIPHPHAMVPVVCPHAHPQCELESPDVDVFIFMAHVQDLVDTWKLIPILSSQGTHSGI